MNRARVAYAGSYQNKSMTTTSSAGGGKRPDLAAKLNAEICCEDLAERLGLERPQKGGLFRSPGKKDTDPSLSCYVPEGGGPKRFKDWSQDVAGGPVDLYMHATGADFVTAVKELAKMYAISVPAPAAAGGPRQEPTLAEFIGEKCIAAARPGMDGREALLTYLCGHEKGQRHLERKAVEFALERRALGMNLWTKPGSTPGERGHGGPAAAFLVRSRLDGRLVGVDMRYMDPELNGGQKTQSQGEKVGAPWTACWRKLRDARTVYMVESAINALSVDSADMKGAASLAIRGTQTIEGVDWSFLRGKLVVNCLDNDHKPYENGENKGFCPGPLASWRLHEILTGMDIACLLVDQSGWTNGDEPINDLNDLLQLRGPKGVEAALKLLETCAIPGLPTRPFRKDSRPRLWLPTHDFHAYGRYTVEPDFTRSVKEVKREEDGTEKIVFNDVAGFRIAAVSRVQIASPTSTMTGDEDNSPRTVFALSVQVARHGSQLQRRVVDDEKLHNQDVWKKLGPIYAPTAFARLVNVWERASSIGAREAINFVGLAWRDGRVVVNEGPDCFFTDARQQCPYSDLVFPSGTLDQAREVLGQFQATFRDNAALILLVWGLGAHLKAFLGFWPHFVMQAEKGTGKSTLVKRLERAIAMVMSSRQSLQTEFRQLTSVSYTSHPVGWGEMSANKQDIINKAIHNLQECYQYEHTRRGAELIDYLLCAPVLLAGEDVPVQSLQGKVVRSELTLARRGPVMPQDLPVFPVKQWLQFLTRQTKARVLQLHEDLSKQLSEACVATTSDSGAQRMVQNYAALAAAWHLLCEFAQVEVHQGGFVGSVIAEMNAHIGESVSDRQPWAWITEKLLTEIAQRTFRLPFLFCTIDEVPVLCVRTSHVMAHISSQPTLREFWDHLPVKSDRVYKKQLAAAGVLLEGEDGQPLAVERTVHNTRVSNMVAMPLASLAQFGLHAVVPKEQPDADPSPKGGVAAPRDPFDESRRPFDA